LNYKNRILLFDSDKHDRALLNLALRSALPNLEVLEAASAVEVAHHISTGPIDALVADPVARFDDTIAIALDIRKRYPACLCWLFSGESSLPQLRECVGRGIDGRIAKTSAGFLELPNSIVARLDWIGELNDRVLMGSDAVFSSVFPGATCLISHDGKLLMVSEEFERLVEQPRFVLVGQAFAEFWLDDEKRVEWQQLMTGAPRHWEFVGRFRGPGSTKPVMAIALHVLGSEANGRNLWAATMTDITGLIITDPGAIDGIGGDSDLDHIAFALSHDLQAPLNSLASHAETLKQGLHNESAEIKFAVTEVDGIARRMQQMLDGIVEHTVFASEDKAREIINLDSVLEEAIANLRSMIDESGATIERQPLPALAVARPQMIQVFQNLISNAIKFCGSRIARIRIYAVETSEHLHIRFEDNGIGIDPRNHEKIFDMFHRLHSDKEYPGVGAGLAICRRIVRAHGGDIKVESTLDRGSCFILEFRGAAVRNLNVGGGTNEAIG